MAKPRQTKGNRTDANTSHSVRNTILPLLHCHPTHANSINCFRNRHILF